MTIYEFSTLLGGLAALVFFYDRYRRHFPHLIPVAALAVDRNNAGKFAGQLITIILFAIIYVIGSYPWLMGAAFAWMFVVGGIAQPMDYKRDISDILTSISMFGFFVGDTMAIILIVVESISGH